MNASCKSQEQDFIHSGNVRKEMNISEPGNCEMSSECFPGSKSSNWKAGAQVNEIRAGVEKSQSTNLVNKGRCSGCVAQPLSSPRRAVVDNGSPSCRRRKSGGGRK